jgi:hypothetical protein
VNRLLLLLLPAALTACTSVAAEEPKVLGAGECRNNELARFSGQPATQDLGAEMLRVSGAKLLQWISPGMMVTMDFRSDRLRVRLGPDGKVMSARCG